MAACRRAIDAEIPPPFYTNPVTEIEKRIALTKELIRGGVRKEELKAELSIMRKDWAESLGRRDAGIRKAWEVYWEIWGRDAGPVDA